MIVSQPHWGPLDPSALPDADIVSRVEPPNASFDQLGDVSGYRSESSKSTRDLLLTMRLKPIERPEADEPDPEGPEWLYELYARIQDDRVDDAIALLFDEIDDLLVNEKFEACNDLLLLIDTQQLNADVLVALLIVTHPASEKLEHRPNLVRRIERALRELVPDQADELLRGRT